MEKIQKMVYSKGNYLYIVGEHGVVKWNIESVEIINVDGKVTTTLHLADTALYSEPTQITINPDSMRYRDNIFTLERDALLKYYKERKERLEYELIFTNRELDRLEGMKKDDSDE